MKFTILCLALCFAYIASESCRSLSDCRHTKCNNSTTGWRVVCHHNGSISGTCLCSEDTITGRTCKVRTDCDLAADCTHSYHSVHCIDESCQCAYAPAINLG